MGLKRCDYPSGDEGLKEYNRAWRKGKGNGKSRWQSIKNDPDRLKRICDARNDRNERNRVAIAGRPKPDRCEICGGFGKTVLDHCHVTGKFRGWLCEPCNRALGMFNDDPERFRRAAAYIEGVLDSGVTA